MTRSARGRSSPRRAARPSSERSAAPLDATATGSTTNGWRSQSTTAAATASTTAASPSIPVFVAPTPMSAATAAIWAATIPADRTSTACTATVFWAVTAVMAQVPQTP